VTSADAAAGFLAAWRGWVGASDDLATEVARLADLACLVLRNGGRILLCGNGGSAADAEHFAGEMVGRFAVERRAYRVSSLTTNTAVLTAIGNDYGVERIFARQVEAEAGPGDCLIVLSTSGRSPNILAALRAGRRMGTINVALVGPDRMPPASTGCVDVMIAVPAPAHRPGLATPHIQAIHAAVLHCLAHVMEAQLAGIPERGAAALRPAVFLDRDGTLVEKCGYLTDPGQLRLIPGAGEAVKRLNDAGVAAVVATNQSALARGLLDETRLAAIHERLRALLLADGGGALDGVYYCPHHPEHGGAGRPLFCACRKPLPGMMLQAAAELNLSLSVSTVVGDTIADVQAGISFGGRGLLVETGDGLEESPRLSDLPCEAKGRWAAVPDVLSAVDLELARMRGGPSGGSAR
jgi:D-glycero-D-manno-heptose 1,7-bisphosphate phosphatase